MVPPRGDEADRTSSSDSNRKRNYSGTTNAVPTKKSNKTTPIIIVRIERILLHSLFQLHSYHFTVKLQIDKNHLNVSPN